MGERTGQLESPAGFRCFSKTAFLQQAARALADATGLLIRVTKNNPAAVRATPTRMPTIKFFICYLLEVVPFDKRMLISAHAYSWRCFIFEPHAKSLCFGEHSIRVQVPSPNENPTAWLLLKLDCTKALGFQLLSQVIPRLCFRGKLIKLLLQWKLRHQVE